MKKIVCTIVFVLSAICAQAQTIKMRTTYASHKIADQEWSDWVEFKTLAVINTEKNNLTIYGNPNEVYEIIDQNEMAENTGIVLSLNCIDNKGEECRIDIQVDGNKDVNVLYITYPNAIMAISFDKA